RRGQRVDVLGRGAGVAQHPAPVLDQRLVQAQRHLVRTALVGRTQVDDVVGAPAGDVVELGEVGRQVAVGVAQVVDQGVAVAAGAAEGGRDVAVAVQASGQTGRGRVAHAQDLVVQAGLDAGNQVLGRG